MPENLPTSSSETVQLPDAETLYLTMRDKLSALRVPNTYVAGITSGGAWLAQRLQQDWSLDAVGTISTSLHRDDFARRGLSHAARTTLPFEVNGAHILLIDDVLYTGRTIRAAINEIFDFGRPASVQLAVLVDRGGRQLPIEATVAAAHITLPENHSLVLHKNSDETLELVLRPFVTSPEKTFPAKL